MHRRIGRDSPENVRGDRETRVGVEEDCLSFLDDSDRDKGGVCRVCCLHLELGLKCLKPTEKWNRPPEYLLYCGPRQLLGFVS